MERDGQLTYRKIRRYISTHTLTWSVTSLAVAAKTADGISTHTLTWSVTLCHHSRSELLGISTHTLTWSVTPLLIRISRNF